MNALPQPVKRAVPLLDLKPQYQSIKADVDAAIAKVCASQYFILGPEVQELEVAIAKYSGARFGIGMSSGTDALLIAHRDHSQDVAKIVKELQMIRTELI